MVGKDRPPVDPAQRMFIAIDDYKPPAMPTQERLRRLLARFYALFRNNNDVAFIADDRLQKTTLKRLDHVVAPPACGPVIEELQATVVTWRAESPVTSRTRLIVLPPCDVNDVVGQWAREYGHPVVPPPDRAALPDIGGPIVLPDTTATGLMVIPDLTRWFLRERGGLDQVSRLLATINESGATCVIGCNSWAWAFLCKAVDADMVLPAGLVFQPFDGDRLRAWFADLAREDLTSGIRFRMSQTGADVLDVEAAGEADTEFFAKLAGRSRGIPWVAWHLWRRSLRSDRADRPDGVTTHITDPSKETLWIAALDELVLPGHHPQYALLVLHALLIHGAMLPDELHRVLPIIGDSNIVAALLMSGFIERDGEAVRCRAAAYPAIRDGLSAAGYPKDKL